MNSGPTLNNESSAYFFTDRELARLNAYRAAILARFYTDHCEPTPMPIDGGLDVVRLFNQVRRPPLSAA